ncbi:hypothetical protein V6N13_024682 [Hibiscus sabdariffa]
MHSVIDLKELHQATQKMPGKTTMNSENEPLEEPKETVEKKETKSSNASHQTNASKHIDSGQQSDASKTIANPAEPAYV